MQKISAVIIDTYPNKKLALFAIKKILKLNNISKLYILSDEPFFQGAEFCQIPKIESVSQYSSLVINKLPWLINENHFLLFQWDGFPVSPSNWDDVFFEYDYIGAPIPVGPTGFLVGNGGFSFRSKKLLDAVKQINIATEKLVSEDLLLCVDLRLVLENYGIKYAPVDVARRFSYESGPAVKDVFGFHGVTNFPLLISEFELLELANEIIDACKAPELLLMYLKNCLTNDMLDLFKESVIGIEKKPNLINAVNYEIQKNPNSGFVKVLMNFN